MKTLSFILAMPKRVMPSTSPCACVRGGTCARGRGKRIRHLEGHQVRHKHGVARVDVDAVVGHDILHLVHDDGSRVTRA